MIAISCLEKYVCIINTETLQKRILALESEPIIDLMFVDDFLIVLSTLRILFVSTSENLVLEYMLDLPIDPGSHLLAVANRAGVFMVC